MARVLQGIEKGIKLYEENGNVSEVDILFGGLDPGGDSSDQDAAPIGSIYLKTSGEIFQKTKNDGSLSDWESYLKDDYHSGYYFIPQSKTVKVLENKQMTTFGILTIAGDLLAEGEVIIEE
jgi:hypothetical protein